MKETGLPEKILAIVNETAPSLLRDTDAFRAMFQPGTPAWPDNIHFPFPDWVAQFTLPDNDPHACRFVIASYCAAAWRHDRRVVLFDPDTRAALRETELPAGISSLRLWRLPAWGLYVRSPGLAFNDRQWDGFFAVPDLLRKCPRLLVHFVSEDALPELAFLPVMLTLGEHPIGEALKKQNSLLRESCVDFGEKNRFVPSLEGGLREALNLVLYLAAYGFGDREGHEGFRLWPYLSELRRKEPACGKGEPPVVLGGKFGEQIRAMSDRTEGARPYWETFTRLSDDMELEEILRWHPPLQ